MKVEIITEFVNEYGETISVHVTQIDKSVTITLNAPNREGTIVCTPREASAVSNSILGLKPGMKKIAEMNKEF